MDAIAGIAPPPRIKGAIAKASAATGVDFAYLLQTAYRESSFRPDLTATTSTATGLFQFLENTWLGAIKDYGTQFGLGGLADQIIAKGRGRYDTTTPGAREQILALRQDPEWNALFAGAVTRNNAQILERALDRPATGAELYLAHFFGPRDAVAFIRLHALDPEAAAAPHFPAPAEANRAVFFANGQPRSAAEVYRVLTKLHDPAPVAIAKPEGNALSPHRLAIADARFEPRTANSGLGSVGVWSGLSHTARVQGLFAVPALSTGAEAD